MDVFPLDPLVTYRYAQAFGDAHKGTDIFAARGQAILAVEDGAAVGTTDPKGGRVVYLQGRSGTKYYYAHLDDWAPALEQAGAAGLDVDAGAWLGTVGTTGNARGTPPHLHFEVHPPRQGAVDPFPLLQAVDPKAGEQLPNLGKHPLPPTLFGNDKPALAPASNGLGGVGVLLVLYALSQRKRSR